jgi:hypothetical protein
MGPQSQPLLLSVQGLVIVVLEVESMMTESMVYHSRIGVLGCDCLRHHLHLRLHLRHYSSGPVNVSTVFQISKDHLTTASTLS